MRAAVSLPHVEEEEEEVNLGRTAVKIIFQLQGHVLLSTMRTFLQQ